MSIKLLACNSCSRFKLEYAAIVWDPLTKKDVNKLGRVQRTAVRLIYRKYRRQNSLSLIMQQDNIQTLQARRKFSRLTFLHNCLSVKVKFILPACSIFLRRAHVARIFFSSAVTCWNKFIEAQFLPENSNKIELSSPKHFFVPGFH